jgi:Bacterial TSP3 repeat
MKKFTKVLMAITVIASPAFAKPPGQKTFCDEYPLAPTCKSGQTVCATCHTSPPALNLFGTQVSQKLAPGGARPLTDEAYASALPEALRAVDSLDADGDGISNGDEIRAGSDPANAQSKPSDAPCTASPGAAWNLCGYDAAYTYRKVLLDFCGRSANYEERQAFAKSNAPKELIHETLEACLKSEFWQGRNGAVWNLASPKIRPIQSIKAGQDAGPVPLADYYRDYALFVYATTGDRDARDLLRAQYSIVASKTVPTTYSKLGLSFEQDLQENDNAAELAQPERRAGMISSSWFRVINTMFTAVPRTTAAQAYRAYLGLDIALLQGLQPGASAEPIDYDNKGVRASGCISCHQTLDPLSYPFSRYEGIDQDEKSFQTAETFGSYRKDRMARFVVSDGPNIVNVPEEGVLFGKPVKNLVEWAAVASDTDEFAQKTVLDFWHLLFGVDPKPSETEQFTKLWKRFRNENGYQIEKMLSDLVDTEAYGAP